MLVKLLKAKLHSGAVTDAKLHYQGSMKVDSELLEKVGIMPYESVIVSDLTNGNRLETYVIPAPAGSGEIVILGAAAKLINPKDRIIIMNFAFFTPEEAKNLKPKVLVLDENNKIVG